MLPDEFLHQSYASLILKNGQPDSTRPQQVLFAEERPVLGDDDVRDAVEQDGAAAHRAWGQCRVHHAVAVDRRRTTSCTLQGVHFPVEHGTALLDSTVVTASNDLIVMHENRTDRNASFGEAQLRLGNSRVKEGPHIGHCPTRLPCRPTTWDKPLWNITR